MFASAPLVPLTPNPWTSTTCGAANPYYYVKLLNARDACAKNTVETLTAYVDLLHVFVDELDKSRKRADGNTGFTSNWNENGQTSCLRSVRGELVVATAALCRVLVATDTARNWELVVRLQLWVTQHQLASWFARPAGLEVCTPRASNQLIALAMVRIQLQTFDVWEKKGAKGSTGARLLLWSLALTQRLAQKKPELKNLVDEQTALLCLYAPEKQSSKRSVLLQHASLLFERLQMPARIEQVHRAAPLLDVRREQQSYADIIRACVKSTCPLIKHLHFRRDYVPREAAEHRRLFYQPA